MAVGTAWRIFSRRTASCFSAPTPATVAEWADRLAAPAGIEVGSRRELHGPFPVTPELIDSLNDPDATWPKDPAVLNKDDDLAVIPGGRLVLEF